ncbi:MAG: PEP-CTERM sorting domain-containing protein [Gammaproteobacteria bacterium]|nr:PEP-CTERM sorting domain-containing protein [Gammaproteobacteria bacterium]
MKVKNYYLAATFGLLTLLWTAPSYSVPITFSFSGTVTNYFYDPGTGDAFGGSVGAGTTFTGFYTFESTSPDWSAADPEYGGYHSVLLPYGMIATIGGNTVSGLGSDMLIDVWNTPGGDSYTALALDYGFQSLGIQLSGGSSSVFDNDSLLLSPPDIADFAEARFGYVVTDPFGPVVLSVIGTLTELTLVSTIPEPASLALMGLGLAGLGFARRKKRPVNP